VRINREEIMTTQTRMSKIGLHRASGGIQKRIILSVEAREKRGKTNFALTAPDPHAIFDFDTGMEGVVEKFADSREIYVGDYRRNADKLLTQAEWTEIFLKFKMEYQKSLQDPDIRTVTLDTATEAWELLRLHKFGKLSQVMPNMYGPANDEFRGLIRAAFGSDKNLILLHKMKDEYVASKATPSISNRTGNYIRTGFADTPYLVQMNIRLDRTEEDGFTCEILDCRQNPMIAGMVLFNDDITFQNVATLVFPDTSEEDWA
jgi:hypothetical protein